MTQEELSERAFKLLELELADESAKHQEYELAEVVARFFEAEDPQLRDKAFAVCKRMSLPEDQGHKFYQKLCEHGGEEHIDYFIRFANERRYDFAMKALARLWPREKAADFAKELRYDAVVAELLGRDALPYLRQQLRDDPSVNLARLVVKAAGGQPDPEAVNVLESLLPDLEDFSYDPPYIEGRKLLEMMKQLGCGNTEELRSKLPEADPQMLASRAYNHWIAHDIDQQQLIDFLNTSKAGKSITRNDVYQQIKKNGRPVEEFDHNDLFKLVEWSEGYSAREFSFHALEAAGIAHECCQLEPISGYLNELLEMINRTSVGVVRTSAKSAAKDHRIWLAPEGAPPKMHVTFGRRTFELNVFEDQTHPILTAEALNTMLDQYTEYDHRFYAYIVYPDGYDEHYVAYLKPELAKKLEEDFGLIPFPPY